jgi:parallel beta-helix repeat protein
MNTTWVKTGSPYIISLGPHDSVNVESNATLTIEPGVEVNFTGDSRLTIDGKLIAQGSENQPIYFNGSGPGSYSMPQMTIKGNSSIISYSRIEALSISIWGSKNKIFNVYSNQSTIQFSGSTSYENVISNSTISNSTNYGALVIEWSDYNKILNCTIQHNRDGIHFHHASYNTILGCIITNNSEIGLNLASPYHNIITYNEISYNNKGIVLTPECDRNNKRIYFENNNTIHHNNFIDNTNIHYECSWVDSSNLWNDSNGQGNYWSDYNGTDLNFDGVGDTNIPWLGVDWNPLMVPVENISDYLKQVQKIKKINIELKLNKNQYQLNENITGELIINNNNSIDIYTVSPELYGTNITIEPNIFFEIYNKDLKQKYFSWDAQILKINKYSNYTIDFSLSSFNYSKGWREDLDKLPEGNYSIFSSFKIFTNSSFSIEVYSSPDNFNIINKIPAIPKNDNFHLLKNITISIELFKNEYQMGEPISGVIDITNNNLVDIQLDNIPFQRITGYSFQIQSIENSSNYGGLSFKPQFLKIKAQNSSIFEFEINDIIQLPITSKKINYTILSSGSYSMYAFFYFGNLSYYDIITSNIINFNIVNDFNRRRVNENITIYLELDKHEFKTNEIVTGTVNISNNNSFKIILNDKEYQEIFGVYFYIKLIDNINYSSIYDQHFEAYIDKLPKYQIKPKSSLEINFTIQKYVKFHIEDNVKSIPEGVGKRIYLSNLTTAKYSISGYIYDFYYPDYDLEVIDEFKIWSNRVEFNIIEEVPDEIANITIELQLSKSVYNLSESINGTITISNNNSFDILLENSIYFFQRYGGEHFEIHSIDNLSEFGALINGIKYPIKIKAQNSTIITFSIDKVFKFPLQSKDISFINLSMGNYSIFAYFYYGNFSNLAKLNSNVVTFRIIENKSSTSNLNGPINPSPSSGGSNHILSQSFVFYSFVSLISVILIISTIFIAGTEVGKYGFFGGIIPLYTKARKKKLDKNYGYKKGLVMGCILSNPGESYNAIKRTLDLNNGSLAYYLKVLKREGAIKSERDGMYKRFYPTKVNITTDKFELSNLQKDIYKTIKENLGITQKEISSRLGIAHQTINYHIQLMRDARIIRLDRDGKKTKCFIIEKI